MVLYIWISIRGTASVVNSDSRYCRSQVQLENAMRYYSPHHACCLSIPFLLHFLAYFLHFADPWTLSILDLSDLYIHLKDENYTKDIETFGKNGPQLKKLIDSSEYRSNYNVEQWNLNVDDTVIVKQINLLLLMLKMDMMVKVYSGVNKLCCRSENQWLKCKVSHK